MDSDTRNHLCYFVLYWHGLFLSDFFPIHRMAEFKDRPENLAGWPQFRITRIPVYDGWFLSLVHHDALLFSLFKYLLLIVGSPLFAYMSEKTESIIEGKPFPFQFQQLKKDMLRGIKLSARNSLWQTVYLLTILLLSYIPLIGWLTPAMAVLIECYYYGFSMLDYSMERHQKSPAESIFYISSHKGLAIGNGLVFLSCT